MVKHQGATIAPVMITAVIFGALAGPGAAQEEVTLSWLIDNSPDSVAAGEALAKAFTAANPSINIEIETRPGGGEGDNIIKTRLATEEMTDIFLYNAGSLFQAINPQRNLVPLTDEPYMQDVAEAFKAVVTAGNDVYGVPAETAMGGGILYNRKIYEELELEIPKSWDAFMANNAALKEAGHVPVIQTFRDTWTSQLFVLADFYNVQAAEPDFAARYTANQAKYATTPAAMKGFEHQAEVFKAGYLNEDFGAAGYPDGLRMIATGEGTHYPMLTTALAAIKATYPEHLDDVGFFAMPGDSAESNGVTVWMPAALYIARTTEYPDEAKAFLAFVASAEGCNVQSEAVGISGPYMIKSCSLPDDVPPAVTDLQRYFEEGGKNAPALEFVSPVKGPSLEQITVEVGSGFRSPQDAAALYDEDVRKQALQLGLPGW